MYLLEHKHKQVRQDKSQVNYIVTFRDRILKTFHCRFRSSHSCSWDICMFSSKSHVLVNLTIDVIWPWSLSPRFLRCHKMEFHASPLLPTFHNTISCYGQDSYRWGWETSHVTKFLLHQTDQNGLSHVISHVSHVTKTPHPHGRPWEVYYERGRRPSEFSLNMRIFSSWATRPTDRLTDRPTDRPTVTLFSVLYLLNQATDWQTVFGIWKRHSINHSY